MTAEVEHGRCMGSHDLFPQVQNEIHCKCPDGMQCSVYPGSGADGVARYMAEESGAKAALVMQSGSADETIETLIAGGWTLSDDVEYINGKRIRYMVPPQQWWLDDLAERGLQP